MKKNLKTTLLVLSIVSAIGNAVTIDHSGLKSNANIPYHIGSAVMLLLAPFMVISIKNKDNTFLS